MDKVIFKVGDWTCAGFDKIGLEQLKEANCAGYDTQYALGTWVLIGFFLAFVVPAMARSARDFLLGGGRNTRSEKE